MRGTRWSSADGTGVAAGRAGPGEEGARHPKKPPTRLGPPLLDSSALTGLSPAPWSSPFSEARTQLLNVALGMPSTRAVTDPPAPPSPASRPPACFRPERDIAALRAYLRLRERHLDYAAAHIQHMQKALTLMNLHETKSL